MIDAPLAGIFWLKKDPENALEPMSQAEAAGAMLDPMVNLERQVPSNIGLHCSKRSSAQSPASAWHSKKKVRRSSNFSSVKGIFREPVSSFGFRVSGFESPRKAEIRHSNVKRKHMNKAPLNIIAIDGPAGSGKSTAARRLAQALKFTYLNTGAMYRAAALLAQEGGFDLSDEKKVSEVAGSMRFEYHEHEGRQRFVINGTDRTEELFTAALTAQLKPVVNNPLVRGALVEKMRSAAYDIGGRGANGVVLEGRDIGTVVFPEAFIKFYIHADIDARTERRAAELQAKVSWWILKA